jgi:hypothetical protein
MNTLFADSVFPNPLQVDIFSTSTNKCLPGDAKICGDLMTMFPLGEPIHYILADCNLDIASSLEKLSNDIEIKY